METPADLALQRQLQAPEVAAGAASSKAVTALWVLGLLTASVAITLAAAAGVREPLPPPVPGLRKNAYLLAISVAFYAGVSGVMAAVCTTTTTPAADRRATGTKNKLVYSTAVVIVVAAGALMVVVSLLW